MKIYLKLLACGLIGIATSCSWGLMNDTEMDGVDWGSVDENTFIGKDNIKEIANGDLIIRMRRWYFESEKYYLFFITSSDNYYITFRLAGEPFPYPINEKGVLSFDHYISEGLCKVTLKEDGPFWPEIYSTHCKLLIDCDVKQSGGYHELESGIYGEKMKGDVKIKIVTMDGNNYKFSYNGIIPLLDTSEWKSTGSPYE